MDHHNTEDCRHKHNEDKEANGKEQAPQRGMKFKKNGIACYYCKKQGHYESDCPLKKKHRQEITRENEEKDSDTEEDKKKNTIGSAQLHEKSIADLCQRLKNGEIKLEI